jgi:hypothetical protein
MGGWVSRDVSELGQNGYSVAGDETVASMTSLALVEPVREAYSNFSLSFVILSRY